MKVAADTEVCECAEIEHYKCLGRHWKVGSYTETCGAEAVMERMGEEGITCIWFLINGIIVGLVLQGLSHAGNVIYSCFNLLYQLVKAFQYLLTGFDRNKSNGHLGGI